MLLFNMRAACFARATPAQILEPLDLPDQRLLEQSPKYRKNRLSATPQTIGGAQGCEEHRKGTGTPGSPQCNFNEISDPCPQTETATRRRPTIGTQGVIREVMAVLGVR